MVGIAQNKWTASIGLNGRHGPDYAFHLLSLQHNELLPQVSVFEYQFRLAAAKVQHGIEGKGLAVRLCPTTETFLDCVAQGSRTSWDEVRELEIHGPPFWLVSGGLDYTMKRDPESKNTSCPGRKMPSMQGAGVQRQYPVLAENTHPFEDPSLRMNNAFWLFGLTR